MRTNLVEPSMKNINKDRKMDGSYCERLHMTSDILVKTFLICKGYVCHLNKLWKGRTPCLGLAWKQKLERYRALPSQSLSVSPFPHISLSCFYFLLPLPLYLSCFYSSWNGVFIFFLCRWSSLFSRKKALSKATYYYSNRLRKGNSLPLPLFPIPNPHL